MTVHVAEKAPGFRPGAVPTENRRIVAPSHGMGNSVRLRERLEAAWRGLRANLRPMHGFPRPVLTEGGHLYPGIWMESGPLEALVYARRGGEPRVAEDAHRVFFAHQRPDGQFPAYVLADSAGYGQIQMTVPLAETAWETVADGFAGEAFLADAYRACARWDAWLARHRDRLGVGLVDLYCEYDTGHDHSSRFSEDMRKGCPGDDARVCPPAAHLPWQAPDLSASLYGGRVALARMAEALGLRDEADAWRERAEVTRRAILAYLWDEETLCFYDRDRTGAWRKIVSDALLRVLMEHVVDQAMFDRIFARHIGRADGFWTPYPFPSVAAGDPAFMPSSVENCWGGPSQALAALRAPRWLAQYGRADALRHLMERWVAALADADEFHQQLDPWTGAANTTTDYSPAMCVLIDFHARLAGDDARS